MKLKLPDDRDFGGLLTAAGWVCILMMPLCFLALVLGTPKVADAAVKILLADFGFLGALVTLKTIATSRRGNGNAASPNAEGDRDA